MAATAPPIREPWNSPPSSDRIKRFTSSSKSEILLRTPALPIQLTRAFGVLEPDAWHNLLIAGDNLPILRRLIDMKVEGSLLNADGSRGIRLVYIDPPFASDDNYETKSGKIAYSDKVKGAEFVEGLRKRLVLIRELLADDAFVFVHLDWRKGHYINVILDEVFGESAFRNEIVWKRTNARTTLDRWPRIHDVLLVYTVGDPPFAPEVVAAGNARVPHTLVPGPGRLRYQSYELTGPGKTQQGESGQPWRGFDPSSFGRHWANSLPVREEWDKQGLIHWPKNGGFPRRRAAEPFQPEARTVPVGDVWTDIDRLNQADRGRVYPTQKPDALLRRVIAATTGPGDLVLDCFVGSGTTLIAAEKLGRRWIGADMGVSAIYFSQKRLLNIAASKAFAAPGGAPVKVVPYGQPARPFGLYSSGLYDFARLRDLPFADYRRFVIRLFGGTEHPETINGLPIDGRHRGDPIMVFDFHADPEAQVTPEYFEDLAGYLGQRAGERVLFIAPASRLTFLQDEIRVGDITFDVRRVPYSVVNALRRFGTQPASQADINRMIESEGFDFTIPPKVETEVDPATRRVKIKSFRCRAIAKDMTEEKRGFDALAMILIDYDHSEGIFDLDAVLFGDELAKAGWSFELTHATPGQAIAISYNDIFGNERIEVLTQQPWVAAAVAELEPAEGGADEGSVEDELTVVG